MKYQVSAVVEGNESEKSAAVTAVEPVGAGKIDNADERIAYVGDWGQLDTGQECKLYGYDRVSAESEWRRDCDSYI